jgi:6-phosphogluconolactonase (cycloisomerase 2 family)
MDGYSRLQIAFVPGLGRPGSASARSQEIKRRMRIRFTWIAALLALIAIGLLAACSTKYSASNNGLVVLPTGGSAVMQSFSLDLGNGHLSQINNAAGPPIPGASGQVILDPAGAYAYVVVTATTALTTSTTGIASFPVASDGKLAAAATITGNPVAFTQGTSCEQIPVTPVAIAIDSAGKFLFAANSATADSAGNSVPGSISVFAVGTNGTLTEVNPTSCTAPSTPGSPFPLPSQAMVQTPNASALAVTPTVYPFQYAYCSTFTPPTTEDLYVTDSANYIVLNYAVSSTGGLTLVPAANNATGISTGSAPSGVAVDPCNRFVFVSNAQQNSVSAYSICTAVSTVCQYAKYSLQAVAGSPFNITGQVPGPLTVDAYANFLYVVNTGSSNVTGFRISASTGGLTAIGTYAAGVGANSIAVRSDDSWLFVANSTASTVSQYAITPSSGVLAPQPVTTTFNIPTGVAVK